MKIPNPQKIGDFRPISLCNVLYKVIAKMLVNRMRIVLNDLVSKFQSFVSSRTISDTILIAHEVIEHIRKRTKGKKAFMVLKLDMNKAYDRVNWDFLLKMLQVMGFSSLGFDWIHQCITTMTFSISVNGNRSKPFHPACGLRPRRSAISIFVHSGSPSAF